MSWREEEAQKNGGWTIWKEILGTALGVLPFLVTVGLAALRWGGDIERNVAVDAQRITALELQRSEIAQKLDRISDKIDVIAQTVAAEKAIERR